MRKAIDNINFGLAILLLIGVIGGSIYLDDEIYEIIVEVQLFFAVYYYSYLFGIYRGRKYG
jgi:hypothetical protein